MCVCPLELSVTHTQCGGSTCDISRLGNGTLYEPAALILSLLRIGHYSIVCLSILTANVFIFILLRVWSHILRCCAKRVWMRPDVQHPHCS